MITFTYIYAILGVGALIALIISPLWYLLKEYKDLKKEEGIK